MRVGAYDLAVIEHCPQLDLGKFSRVVEVNDVAIKVQSVRSGDGMRTQVFLSLFH